MTTGYIYILVLCVYNSFDKPGRRGELLEDRPHIIESGVVQDTSQRLTRIELRPRVDDLVIFIKSDVLLHLTRQDEEDGTGVRELACLHAYSREQFRDRTESITTSRVTLRTVD